MASAVPRGYRIHLYLWQAVNNMDSICLGLCLDWNLFFCLPGSVVGEEYWNVHEPLATDFITTSVVHLLYGEKLECKRSPAVQIGRSQGVTDLPYGMGWQDYFSGSLQVVRQCWGFPTIKVLQKMHSPFSQLQVVGPFWTVLQSWRHEVPTLCRANPTEYHWALVLVKQTLPSWRQGRTGSSAPIWCRGCLRLQSTVPVKDTTAFCGKLPLPAMFLSSSWTKELVCSNSRSVWPVCIITETDQKNKCSDNTSEEMVTSSKREEAGMADRVTSSHGVAACPHWESTRCAMGSQEWYAVHCGALDFLDTNN